MFLNLHQRLSSQFSKQPPGDTGFKFINDDVLTAILIASDITTVLALHPCTFVYPQKISQLVSINLSASQVNKHLRAIALQRCVYLAHPRDLQAREMLYLPPDENFGDRTVLEMIDEVRQSGVRSYDVVDPVLFGFKTAATAGHTAGG